MDSTGSKTLPLGKKKKKVILLDFFKLFPLTVFILLPPERRLRDESSSITFYFPLKFLTLTQKLMSVLCLALHCIQSGMGKLIALHYVFIP